MPLRCHAQLATMPIVIRAAQISHHILARFEASLTSAGNPTFACIVGGSTIACELILLLSSPHFFTFFQSLIVVKCLALIASPEIAGKCSLFLSTRRRSSGVIELHGTHCVVSLYIYGEGALLFISYFFTAERINSFPSSKSQNEEET